MVKIKAIILSDNWVYINYINLHYLINCRKGYMIQLSETIWIPRRWKRMILFFINQLQSKYGIQLPTKKIILLKHNELTPKKFRISYLLYIRDGDKRIKEDLCYKIFSCANK